MNVKLPNDPKLAGKSIRLPSRISVEYPFSTGLFGFENREAEFSHEFQFQLAAPNAALTYYALWWGGLLAGGGSIVLSAFVLRQVQLSRFQVSPRPRTLYAENVGDAANKKERPLRKKLEPKKDASEQCDDLEFIE